MFLLTLICGYLAIASGIIAIILYIIGFIFSVIATILEIKHDRVRRQTK